MGHVNIEIKARCGRTDRVREFLRASGADFRGIDCQTDMYFRVPSGRLKLRQGTIENALIFYRRTDQRGPKRAEVSLYRTEPNSALAEVLTCALPILVTVKKQREIYLLDNVKFHIDSVAGLGRFVEIEAIDTDGSIGAETLRQQCELYMKRLEIDAGDLAEGSYCDLLLDQEGL